MAPSFSKLAIAAALTGLATAAPAPSPKAGRFTVSQVKNENFKRSGALQVAKTHLKYGKEVSDELALTLGWKKNGKRETGSAVATPEENDVEYLTPVTIGTPGQTLNLDFDSGSSDLWVFSTDTQSSDVSGQTVYDPSSSSSSQRLSGASWDISYGDGSTSSGIVYTDDVTVGGVTVSGQAVEAAEEVSSTFTAEGVLDGLLGLAFSKLNTVTPQSQQTWFDNAKSSLDAPVWTADLKAGEPGSYDFGYIDDSKYTGEIAYTDVDTSLGYWTFTSSGYAVGDGSLTSTNIEGIADTGTSLLYLPDDILSEYYSQVPGAEESYSLGGWIFDCDASLPDFSFGIGEAKITIPGAYINYAEATAGQCFGGMQSSASIGLNIFGDVALKAAFVVFDSEGPQIGWASKDL